MSERILEVVHAGLVPYGEAIQQLRAAARGFRNFTCYRRAILFFLGKLGRCPQTSS